MAISSATSAHQQVGAHLHLTRGVCVPTEYGESVIGVSIHQIHKNLTGRAAREVGKPLVVGSVTLVQGRLFKRRNVSQQYHVFEAVESSR